jgi:hypothetical protein
MKISLQFQKLFEDDTGGQEIWLKKRQEMSLLITESESLLSDQTKDDMGVTCSMHGD